MNDKLILLKAQINQVQDKIIKFIDNPNFETINQKPLISLTRGMNKLQQELRKFEVLFELFIPDCVEGSPVKVASQWCLERNCEWINIDYQYDIWCFKIYQEKTT